MSGDDIVEYRKVVEYIIMEGNLYLNDEDFGLVPRVNQYLKLGWDLYGFPYPSQDCETHCQALVKYE